MLWEEPKGVVPNLGFLGSECREGEFLQLGKKNLSTLELEQELLKCSHEKEMFFLNFPINANYQEYVQNVTLLSRPQ